MIKQWKELALARLCSASMSAFRKYPLQLTPEDLRRLRLSFSQFGEDLVVAEFVSNHPGTTRGIYIDAGCFDPYRYSNTRLLHLMGWRGINIDAGSDVIEKFQKHRPDDHNVCAALSDQETDMQLVGAEGGAARRLLSPAEDQKTTLPALPVKTTSLSAVLQASPWKSSPVDLLDIDCEGHDLKVLQGFPFAHVQPRLICIEAHAQRERDDILSFLLPKNYFLLAERGPTLIMQNILPGSGGTSDQGKN